MLFCAVALFSMSTTSVNSVGYYEYAFGPVTLLYMHDPAFSDSFSEQY